MSENEKVSEHEKVIPRRARVVINAGSVPRFSPHVRFQEDKIGERWVVLGPERMFVPDEIAVHILKRMDGVKDVAAISAELAAAFDAPLDLIQGDVITLLQDLADKVVVVA